jgi:hypothetical protein
MIFRHDEVNSSVSTIRGTLGWPTDEAENDEFAEPFSTVSQLVRQPYGEDPITPEPEEDDAFDRERYEAPEVLAVRVPEETGVPDQHEEARS